MPAFTRITSLLLVLALIVYGVELPVARAQVSVPAVRDSQVMANVLAAIRSDSEVAGQRIHVTVIYGAVTLAGSFTNQAVKARTENLIAHTYGVKKVYEQATVQSSIPQATYGYSGSSTYQPYTPPPSYGYNRQQTVPSSTYGRYQTAPSTYTPSSNYRNTYSPPANYQNTYTPPSNYQNNYVPPTQPSTTPSAPATPSTSTSSDGPGLGSLVVGAIILCALFCGSGSGSSSSDESPSSDSGSNNRPEHVEPTETPTRYTDGLYGNCHTAAIGGCTLTPKD